MKESNTKKLVVMIHNSLVLVEPLKIVFKEIHMGQGRMSEDVKMAHVEGSEKTKFLSFNVLTEKKLKEDIEFLNIIAQ